MSNPRSQKPHPGAAKLSPLDPAGRTDLANARRFLDLYGDDVRWCEPWRKWLVWDGTRWEKDQKCAVQGKAATIASDIKDEIGVTINE